MSELDGIETSVIRGSPGLPGFARAGDPEPVVATVDDEPEAEESFIVAKCSDFG